MVWFACNKMKDDFAKKARSVTEGVILFWHDTPPTPEARSNHNQLLADESRHDSQTGLIMNNTSRCKGRLISKDKKNCLVMQKTMPQLFEKNEDRIFQLWKSVGREKRRGKNDNQRDFLFSCITQHYFYPVNDPLPVIFYRNNHLLEPPTLTMDLGNYLDTDFEQQPHQRGVQNVVWSVFTIIKYNIMIKQYF